jgi:transposase-like protein
MDPSSQFCPNFYCLKRGLAGQGHIRVHSRKEQRFRCTTCQKTFAASKNTPYYRRHKPLELITIVLTLLTHGCPRQAIVAAYGLDERTVADWHEHAGQHAQRFHELRVQQGQVEAQHIQADELWVKMVGRKVWMAMAMAVPSRLWLGGVISRRRDGQLITTLVRKVKSCLSSLAVLVCVDGLASYVSAFLRVFRHKVQGRRGRPRLVVEAGLLIGQVIKRYSGRRVREVVRRVVRGSAEAIAAVLRRTGTGTGINTAYIERLNATFRASLNGLVRRGRALWHQEGRLQAGMSLVGCAYNWCWDHDSLRVATGGGGGVRKWSGRTPAMAAGLTDRRWELGELLRARVTPAEWKPPRKQRCRRRRETPPPRAVPA